MANKLSISAKENPPLTKTKIAVIIPALNEEKAIGQVLAELPLELIYQVIVVDNGSSDLTADIAHQNGAEVAFEPKKGYGAACKRGLKLVKAEVDIIIFLDGDYSDYPQEINLLISPILNNSADMVIGSRVLGRRQKGSLTPQQIFGNWLATRLIKLFWGFNYSDLGPFRAIRAKSLAQLQMQDHNFGWTVEMQIKALKQKLKVQEVAVRYKKRLGKSKISGTLSGTIKAGVKILYLIVKYGLIDYSSPWQTDVS
ncbi:MAG: glycosyltransferase family 2 protein [Acidobacteria bacterium]|nr:glycosyltransferase family 2 protein [Acidobacteriota bacterium]